MATSFPTYQRTTGGNVTTVRLTKGEAKRLAVRARQHGHFNRGFDAVAWASKVAVRCPLCREEVTGYVGSTDTAARALDRAVIQHLTEDCTAVTRPKES